MREDFKSRMTARNNALDGCGIGHNVEEKFRAGHAVIAAFLTDAGQRMANQLTYDLLTNSPCGVEIDGEPGRHAVESGLVAQIGALVEWDITGRGALRRESLRT